jgi:diguanylate cyclase (GGDEF)-like protein/PAS domain S-box-containing protein
MRGMAGGGFAGPEGPTDVVVNAVVSADGSGHITQFNPAAERTFGYAAGELLGKPFVMLLHERCHTPYRLQLDRLFSSEDASEGGRTITLDGVRKDGSEFPLELCLVTWRSGADSLYTAIVRDISERRRLAEEREELLQRVEAMARTDELTGLANRRAWDEDLRRELARAARRGGSLCVVLIDLDHFKAFNDEHGHPAGDALLRDAAIAWRMATRITDFLARYGGEEFVVLLPDCPPEEAIPIIERMRASMPEAQTCSAGVAYWDGEESAEELVARADQALYQAKREGRDRVVTSRP